MDIVDKINKLLFEEAGQKAKIKNLAGLVKVLQSSDFGMSKAGGNGYAMNKGGKLVVHDPFWISPKGPELERKRNDWLEGGTYYNYFRDEYGITFGKVKVETIMDHKKYGPNSGGYTQLTIDVIFGIKEGSGDGDTKVKDQISRYLVSKGFDLTKTSLIDFVYSNKKTKQSFKVTDDGRWGYSRLDGAGNILTSGKGLPGIKKIVEEK
jgi:hypothetical protein